jgi:hypothetical protein
MTEVEALAKIATAIEHLALAVGTLGTVAWLTFFFKSQSPNSSINRLCDILEKWLAKK